MYVKYSTTSLYLFKLIDLDRVTFPHSMNRVDDVRQDKARVLLADRSVYIKAKQSHLHIPLICPIVTAFKPIKIFGSSLVAKTCPSVDLVKKPSGGRPHASDDKSVNFMNRCRRYSVQREA